MSAEADGKFRERLADATARYRLYLAAHKMFFTRERALILEAALQQSSHFSVDELLFDMHQQGMRVSRATLYRSLAQLAEAGILSGSDFGHGHMHYEAAIGAEAHEHLVCTSCGAVQEVRSEAFENAVKEITGANGFSETSRKTEIFGICAKCRRAGKGGS
ncbi:MAG: transcriptional repressor [Fibrobacterales bacterium]|nr:transcriptional repressor [Fibrobacterales bacterium]